MVIRRILCRSETPEVQQENNPVEGQVDERLEHMNYIVGLLYERWQDHIKWERDARDCYLEAVKNRDRYLGLRTDKVER